jgi:ribosome-associated translation inhibitor RaiA
MPDQTSTDITSGVVYQTFGAVPTSARKEADELMSKLAEVAQRPVIFAKVKIRNDEERDREQRVLVQGTMDVSGVILRAQAAGPTPIDGLRGVGDRLERQLGRLPEKRQRATKRPPSTPQGAWNSGDLPSDRPGFFDRPPEDRMIVRRKTYSPDERVSLSEALFDLDILDYRFFLFTDDADGTPSIVYEDEGNPAVRKIDGSSPRDFDLRPWIRVDNTPAPIINVADAVTRLNVTDVPFVFFCDGERTRASVVYRRYDGHYGLIVPSTHW